ENIHIEGPTVGVLVANWNSEGCVTVRNINCLNLYDAGTRFLNDPEHIPGPPPPTDRAGGRDQRAQDVLDGLDANARTYIWKWSAAVVIAKCPRPGYPYYEFRGDIHVKGRVVLENIRTSGQCKYLLRDAGYGHHILTTGQSQSVQSQSSAMAYYARVNQYP